MKKKIKVCAYHPEWPGIFNAEALLINQALGEKCVAVHHVGSTSVPGLAAKPKIDIIAVIKDATGLISVLESLGYNYKGEINIPFHFGFAKREGELNVNLHVYHEGNPELELNLKFRDYLREHTDARDEYAQLKYALINEPASHEKNGFRFSGYNLGKDNFIKKILEKSGFTAFCMRVPLIMMSGTRPKNFEWNILVGITSKILTLIHSIRKRTFILFFIKALKLSVMRTSIWKMSKSQLFEFWK